jgi:predicted AAA+ superfamily ATPase
MTGGLPEAVAAWCSTRDTPAEGAAQVERILNDLILGYESDFAKYSGRQNADSIRRVFREAGRQLHTEQDGTTGKFIFSELPSNLSRYERMRGPLDWLESSQLLIRVPICPNPQIPLAQHVTANRFKLFYFFIGVLLRSLDIPGRATLQQRIGTYRGFLLENFVAQELRAHLGVHLYSWVGATSEVEFLVQMDDEVIPVEVKSSPRSRRARSLQAYMNKYTPSRAVKVTGQNYGRSGALVTLPLYALQHMREI